MPQLGQSAGQVTWFSPHGAWQMPSPQTHMVCPPVPPLPPPPGGVGSMEERLQPEASSVTRPQRSAERKIKREDRDVIRNTLRAAYS